MIPSNSDIPNINMVSLLLESQPEIELFKKSLSDRGWCFLQLPEEIISKSKSLLDEMGLFFQESLSAKAKYSFPESIRYGYVSSEFNEAFRILTGNFIKTQPKLKLPPNFSNLEPFGLLLDDLCKKIIEITKGFFCGEAVFQEDATITLLKSSNSMKTELSGYGMLDMVNYFPKKDFLVSEHGDPGLFSISLGSNAEGLKLLDPITNSWIEIPVSSAALWCGSTANELSKGMLKVGWHKVDVKNKALNRQAIWYEVCVLDQIPGFLKNGKPTSAEKKEEKCDDINVFVVTLTGKTSSYIINPSENVLSLQVKVQDTEGIPPDRQRMVFKGKPIEQEKTLSEYNIQNGSIVHLVLRLRKDY